MNYALVFSFFAVSVSSSLPPVHWVVQHNLLPAATLAAFRQAFAQHHISYEEVLAVPFSPELPALQNPRHAAYSTVLPR